MYSPFARSVVLRRRNRTIIDLLGNVFIHKAARSRLSPQMVEPCKEQGRSQPLTPGWARTEHFLNLSSFSCSFYHCSSNFPHFLPYFGLPGGRIAHPGRPWLRHWQRVNGPDNQVMNDYHKHGPKMFWPNLIKKTSYTYLKISQLKAYSLISYRGRSQKFQNLNFLHLFVAFLQKIHFPKGI